jgi:hypothetical protein
MTNWKHIIGFRTKNIFSNPLSQHIGFKFLRQHIHPNLLDPRGPIWLNVLYSLLRKEFKRFSIVVHCIVLYGTVVCCTLRMKEFKPIYSIICHGKSPNTKLLRGNRYDHKLYRLISCRKAVALILKKEG